MKLYIYLFNKYKKEIGIFKIKDNFILKSNDDNYFSYFPKYGENFNSKIILAIEETKSFNIKQVRFLYKNKDMIITFIESDLDTNHIEDNNFYDIFTEVIDFKIKQIVEKTYFKYLAKIKRQVHAIKLSLRVPEPYDICLYLFTIISLIINVASGESGVFETPFTIMLGIISFFRVITNLGKNKHDFNARYNGSKAIINPEKEEIINNIIKNRTNEYKDFVCSSFKANESEITQDIFMYSDKENKNLRNYASTMKLIKSKNRVKKTDDSRNMMGYVLSSKVKEGKQIFNSKLVGLDSDLHFYEKKDIFLKPVTYFDYVTNDESIFRVLTMANNSSYLFNGNKHTLYDNGSFKNIEGSSLTNLIGVNILLILNVDGIKYVVINRQNSFTDVNHFRLMPSGSGSLNYSDFKRNKKLSFNDILRIGMYRELEEESYIGTKYLNDHNARFNILGVARLISKSGKPDFFGKVEIDIAKSELENILKSYNIKQNKFLCTNKEHTLLENNYMEIIKLDKFLKENENNFLYNENESIQLRYTKYLLKM